MSKVCVFLADGFEECEGLVVVDILRRAGAEVTTASIMGRREVTGSHHITVQADALAEALALDEFEMLVLPGGMPGTTHLDGCALVTDAAQRFAAAGKRVAAICAAPSVLGRLGLLEGRKATCYPGFEPKLTGAAITGGEVAVDGTITTGQGLGAAIPFALELAAQLMGQEAADHVREGIVYRH